MTGATAKDGFSGVEAHIQLILQLCAISIYTCTVMNPFMKLLVISCFGLMSKYTDFFRFRQSVHYEPNRQVELLLNMGVYVNTYMYTTTKNKSYES